MGLSIWSVLVGSTLLLDDAVSFTIPRQLLGLRPARAAVKVGQRPSPTCGKCNNLPRRTYHLTIRSSVSNGEPGPKHTWSPQDLTADNPGFLPIPENDYIKKYQNNPNLWPVEFFVIAYRRIEKKREKKKETQILVRRSANGTSKYGVGTGVPATRWVHSSQMKAPTGYKFSEPAITFDARDYPEFPIGEESWSYRKIDICEDAFTGPDRFEDPELESYASKIRDQLIVSLSKQMQDRESMNSWQLSTTSVVQKVVEKPNSATAIQGAFRMSGLFAEKDLAAGGHRYVSFEDAPGPAELVKSMRVYTMFPQMPDPMPLPSTSAEDLKKEILSREDRMVESGRDPHRDKHGRKFTHISTSNVSNTIHGVYFTLDATHISGLDEVPALDLFSTKRIEREWVSLGDLKVLEDDGIIIGKADTKPTFISGFIVRQLVKEGVIKV